MFPISNASLHVVSGIQIGSTWFSLLNMKSATITRHNLLPQSNTVLFHVVVTVISPNGSSWSDVTGVYRICVQVTPSRQHLSLRVISMMSQPVHVWYPSANSVEFASLLPRFASISAYVRCVMLLSRTPQPKLRHSPPAHTAV
nr:hypothetical protein Iba_chr01aCG16520 [Ipomoea batatas]